MTVQGITKSGSHEERKKKEVSQREVLKASEPEPPPLLSWTVTTDPSKLKEPGNVTIESPRVNVKSLVLEHPFPGVEKATTPHLGPSVHPRPWTGGLLTHGQTPVGDIIEKENLQLTPFKVWQREKQFLVFYYLKLVVTRVPILLPRFGVGTHMCGVITPGTNDTDSHFNDTDTQRL
ncbi:hypothetical protein RUM44_012544 [Polyplax serrata]|uniref:Uncharacterized protein n=1 Tax=Polyplax serrata TaxID=468196 RepID=A0ABR1BBK5_POLSC